MAKCNPVPDEDIVTPIIHMNGTSKESLLNALEEAYSAAGDALDKLRQCAPNGRDHYLEPGRLDRAIAQHWERMHHFQAVRDSLEAEASKIQKENP